MRNAGCVPRLNPFGYMSPSETQHYLSYLLFFPDLAGDRVFDQDGGCNRNKLQGRQGQTLKTRMVNGQALEDVSYRKVQVPVCSSCIRVCGPQLPIFEGNQKIRTDSIYGVERKGLIIESRGVVENTCENIPVAWIMRTERQVEFKLGRDLGTQLSPAAD